MQVIKKQAIKKIEIINIIISIYVLLSNIKYV